jgi:NAD+ synthetase
MKSFLKVTVGQINPTVGDMPGNIALMREAALKAQADGSDIVVFPELSLTGYSPGDLLDDQWFARRLVASREALYDASRETPGLYWVVGLPLRREEEGGRPYHNALQVLLDGEVVHTQYKQLLPSTGIFSERRHYEPGADEAKVIRINGARVGFLICEDGWNDEGHDYAVNPFQRLADASPDLVISINASPSQKGKRQVRHTVFSKACAHHKLPLLYVAQVGGQDELVFDGASFAVDATGRIVFEAARFRVDTPSLRFDLASQTFLSEQGDALPSVQEDGLPAMEFYRQQIVLGLRDYARRCGFEKVLVGSSGGIDSALTIALAGEALGPENVVAITMPSVYSSEGSVSDSEILCANLRVKLHHLPIKHIVTEFSTSMLSSTLGEQPRGLALENLQARIRGTLLMTYSNTHGNLLLTTGNKSEIATSLFTLYGDSCGGLNLIGDMYKTEVFLLAKHINHTAGRELIPQVIIDKAPSAELAPDQKDTDLLPPYEVLDDILKLLIEGDLLDRAEAIPALDTYMNLKDSEAGAAVIEKVKRLIARSEYKRRQAPPIIRLRARAFGTGRQIAITARQYG